MFYLLYLLFTLSSSHATPSMSVEAAHLGLTSTAYAAASEALGTGAFMVVAFVLSWLLVPIGRPRKPGYRPSVAQAR